MYGTANEAKKIIDSATFADVTRQLEALAKLARLQNLEIQWTYCDATDMNRRYEKEGEALTAEIKAFVAEHGTPAEEKAA